MLTWGHIATFCLHLWLRLPAQRLDASIVQGVSGTWFLLPPPKMAPCHGEMQVVALIYWCHAVAVWTWICRGKARRQVANCWTCSWWTFCISQIIKMVIEGQETCNKYEFQQPCFMWNSDVETLSLLNLFEANLWVMLLSPVYCKLWRILNFYVLKIWMRCCHKNDRLHNCKCTFYFMLCPCVNIGSHRKTQEEASGAKEINRNEKRLNLCWQCCTVWHDESCVR